MIRVSNVKVPLDHNEQQLLKKLSKTMNVPPYMIVDYTIFKRSLDARKKQELHYVYTMDVNVKDEANVKDKLLSKSKNCSVTPDFAYKLPIGNVSAPTHSPIIIGTGPSGLFAGLLLSEMGLKPILLERGEDVDSRKNDVELFWKDGTLNTESNVQFGEGGAGTFSDGKLTTRIKDTRCRKILEEFVEAGANEDILWDAKPHIGTDMLQGVVKNIRQKIISLGGEVHFSSKVDEILIEDNKAIGVKLADGKVFHSDDIILAVGHSARDTFEMLHEKGVSLNQKPFAVGLRIEHEQEVINERQFGEFASILPPADYALTYTTKKGRGVYTFCMCPGGYVVGASSEDNHLTINGMSYHARDNKYANSAVLVQVHPEDFHDEHPLAGIEFQRTLEKRAFELGGGNYTAPTQSLGEFLYKSEAENPLTPSYTPSVKNCQLKEIFPKFIVEALKEAIPEMGKKMKGFDNKNAILTGVESRSSSPVRINRNENRESTNIQGLYPIGEGAGFAGGIISSAVDGISVAETIFKKYL